MGSEVRGFCSGMEGGIKDGGWGGVEGVGVLKLWALKAHEMVGSAGGEHGGAEDMESQ